MKEGSAEVLSVLLFYERELFMNKIKELAQIIKDNNELVFFGGAGVSTASGIPDFRSSTGLHNKKTKLTNDIEEILTYHWLVHYPDIFYRFYFDNLVYPEAQPNNVHQVLAELDKSKKISIITQNIDGLHQQAGSKRVIELHGNATQYDCIGCDSQYLYNELQFDEEDVPYCKECGSMVRPNIILYNEVLDSYKIAYAIEMISNTNLLIVGGTSLKVNPAASLINYFQGEHLFVINLEEVKLSQEYVFIQEDIDTVFQKIKELLNEEE